MNKRQLRDEMKKKRNNMNRTEKERMDKCIEEKFFNSELFRDSNSIFIYASMSEEVNTWGILNRCLKDGKRVYVPKVHNETRTMKALRIKSTLELNESGCFGILEPTFGGEELIGDTDIILIPGLAFDIKGGRLGYGGGFYDKFLKEHKVGKRISLCYDFQIVEHIPMEEFDETVEYIITENKSYYI